jgi:hypothetical protein
MLRMISVIFGFLVRALVSALFYATPLLGFWLVSSLTAFLGGPSWMAWTAGAFLFPIIPGLWEFQAWAHRRPEKKPLLTVFDRLSLRTFFVGVVFLVVLLYLYPQTAFVALSTRGDWMLDGVKDPRADKVRHVLFATAGGVEWLHYATKTNPFKSLIDPKAQLSADEATKQREKEVAENSETTSDQRESLLFHPEPITKRDGTESSLETSADGANQKQNDQQQKEIGADENISSKIWPWKNAKLHPAVANMPTSVETSIESVASYIATQESDPFLRVKALHDYVADRVAYDSDAYFAGKYPPQDAETVFRTHKSVCAGYANLLSALAAVTKDEVIVVGGNARNMLTNDISGGGHAWNAAKIKGRWYLIDATWDSGSVSREKGFTKGYRTDYLFPPAAVMIEDHFPDESTWQLLAKPLTLGEFLRQPMLTPSFQAADYVLLSPTRAQNEADSTAVAIVENPARHWLMASLESNGQQVGRTGYSTNNKTARLEFPIPAKGTYRLKMYSNKVARHGDYDFVGSVDFVNR